MGTGQNLKYSSTKQRRNLQESLSSAAGPVLILPVVELMNPGLYLDRLARIACINRQVRYENLTPVQRLHISHFRCHYCGLVPLYSLNLAHPTRPRCTKCNWIVSFRSSGKYGKIRKEIAKMIKTNPPRFDLM